MSCETISCEQTVDCPICMECIVGNINKVITECGHCFHTKCLMTNVLHNGFGCPFCRNMMVVEEPEDEEQEEVSVISLEDSINSSMRGRTEEEYNDYLTYNSTLMSVRTLFREEGEQLEENREVEVEEDEEEESTVEEKYPPIEYLVKEMEAAGFTIEKFVKSWLQEHDEYDYIEEECLQIADDIFEALRILISNYEEPTQVVVN